MGAFVRNCRLCKEPMESSPFMMCTTCLSESEKVRNFIKKNPLVSVVEISRSTSVAIKKVESMVKLGLNDRDNLKTDAH